MTREEQILRIAEDLRSLIMGNPHMCCFGEAVDDNGNPQAMVIGFDGYIDLKALAEWVYVRIS
jgi:UDP-glucose 6-dehydrogenase